jgi:hypothetical protein
MNNELLGSVVLAAGTGALVSSCVTAIAQWRERVGRQRELLLTAAVDISKVWIGRIAATKGNAPLSEIMGVELNFEMLNEIFQQGKLSKANRDRLANMVDIIEKERKQVEKERKQVLSQTNDASL